MAGLLAATSVTILQPDRFVKCLCRLKMADDDDFRHTWLDILPLCFGQYDPAGLPVLTCA
ncbi:MAG: hypothetical protein ACE5LU_17320 [Anaerolineae bacterium]